MADITGTNGNEVLIGTSDDDRILGLGGNDDLRGLAGDDRLEGGDGDDVLHGGADDDELIGGAGLDKLYGGLGDDVYVVVDVADFAHEAAGEGSDVVYTAVDYTLLPGSHVERLSSIDWRFTTALRLTGNAFANLIEGNAGNNFLDGRGGADRLIGFGGDDIYLVDDAGDQVIEYGGFDSPAEKTRYGFDTVYASVNYILTRGSFVEVLAAGDRTAATALRLTGNELENIIEGDAGANILNGGGGLDVLRGFEGDDLYIVAGGEIVDEEAGEGNDRVYALDDYTLNAGAHVEELSSISWAFTNPLQLTGNEFANLIAGNAGNNRLDGGGGADRLVGFGGDDSYFVDNAGDVVVEGAGGGADTVTAIVDYALAPGTHVDRLVSGLGSSSIRLTGNDIVNELRGDAGNNLLDGRGGADTMTGFAGSDTYVVDSSGDVVIEAQGGTAFDSVSTLVDYTLPTGSGIERLTSISWALTTPLTLIGNEFANRIEGNDGDNYLDGKFDADVLSGFGGADTFAFTAGTFFGTDRIRDFTPADDTIALDNAVFTTLAPGALPPEAFRVGTSAQDADDRIIYNPATGQLIYDANGNASGIGSTWVRVDPGLSLTAADFIVI